ALWPRVEFQSANRAIAPQLAARRAGLRAAAVEQGFTGTAVMFAENVLDTWQRAALETGVVWPTNAMSRWIFEKFVARTPTNLFALGFLYVPTNTPADF